MSPSMNTGLDRPTATGDPVVRAVLAVTAVVTVIGILALLRAATGGGVDHVTVRIDNQAGLAVQVDALLRGGPQCCFAQLASDSALRASPNRRGVFGHGKAGAWFRGSGDPQRHGWGSGLLCTYARLYSARSDR